MAAAIPDAIRPRLGKFVRLLASDQPGEVVAAADALKRVLAGVGADLNDLGDVISRAPVAALSERAKPKPATSRRKRNARPGDIDLDYERRRDVTEALRRALNGRCLSEWETEFATSILSRMQCGCGRLTERQGETLGRLLQKVGEGSAWA